MINAKAQRAKFSAFAIVRDRYGRIVVDEEIFHDTAKLERLRQEVMKNDGFASDSNPKRDR